MNCKNPIGIFDSGIGGLTVAQSIITHMPHENIVYFGDTAHLPYGNKSRRTIQKYALNVTDILLEKGCKLILIACNSASAAAFEKIKKHVGDRAIIVNVIDPVVHHIRNEHSGARLGLIGTQQTVTSDIYQKKLEAHDSNIQLQSHATPLLATAVEVGAKNEKLIQELLNEYLPHPKLKDIDTLILGCTHYPVIREQISNYYGNKIKLIEAGDVVAKTVKEILEEHDLLNKNGKGEKEFYISDYTDSFSENTKLFFGADVKLKHYPL